MYITLEEKDYKRIAQKIAESNEDNGIVYIEIDGLELEIKYSKEILCHQENNYLHYTLDLIFDYVNVNINSISCMDLDIHYDESEIERITKEIITL